VAYTYNEPVIFHEYALDVAQACTEIGIKSVAVTAGYINEAARQEFFAHMHAANVDLKGFTEAFYRSFCSAELEVVKDTLLYLVRETSVWLEITTLLIPGLNDSDAELESMTQWIASELGANVPLHFTAFHPDWRMMDTPPTPPATLTRARTIALRNGLHHVYTGNVRDLAGGRTTCSHCGQALIERDGYEISAWKLNADACCDNCGTPLAGHFDGQPGSWGNRREPIVI
jgi:pyruvate formate lyase activating enzyme